MTQAQFDREVSSATGESIHTIRSRGFSLVEMPDLSPLTIDWDALYPTEPIRPHRSQRQTKRSPVAA